MYSCLSFRVSGTSPLTIFCARPSTTAVLPDAGLADQHRVVLGAPGQHLHDPLDFLLPADHRVELALTRALGQVAAELVEHQRGGRRRSDGAPAAAGSLPW